MYLHPPWVPRLHTKLSVDRPSKLVLFTAEEETGSWKEGARRTEGTLPPKRTEGYAVVNERPSRPTRVREPDPSSASFSLHSTEKEMPKVKSARKLIHCETVPNQAEHQEDRDTERKPRENRRAALPAALRKENSRVRVNTTTRRLSGNGEEMHLWQYS